MKNTPRAREGWYRQAVHPMSKGVVAKELLCDSCTSLVDVFGRGDYPSL